MDFFHQYLTNNCWWGTGEFLGTPNPFLFF